MPHNALGQVLDLNITHNQRSVTSSGITAAGQTHVAITAMLAPGDSPRALLSDLPPHLIRQLLADIRALDLRRERNGRHSARVLRNQFAFALVPRREQLRRRRGTDKPRVRDPSELHAWDVARCRVDT